MITVHPGFAWWLPPSEDGTGLADEVASSLERANATVVPTARLTCVEAAYWTNPGDKRHLRWVLPFLDTDGVDDPGLARSRSEERLLDALARLAAAGRLTVGDGSRFVGSFRADGLVVPVLHKADTLGLKEIATRREDLVTRAQSGKLRPADIQGGVFTISNLGMYGVDAFSAIVNPPQAAILAVGRITDRVVPVNGQPAVQPTMVLTLSCDHRALDGARGAQFLGALADLVEEPLALLV